jgi:hypothetical protein
MEKEKLIRNVTVSESIRPNHGMRQLYILI